MLRVRIDEPCGKLAKDFRIVAIRVIEPESIDKIKDGTGIKRAQVDRKKDVPKSEATRVPSLSMGRDALTSL
jgi:hypothetical protein